MCLKNTSCKQFIKTKRRLIVQSVEKIQKILTQKQLEPKLTDQLCNQNVLFVELKKSKFVKEQEAKRFIE